MIYIVDVEISITVYHIRWKCTSLSPDVIFFAIHTCVIQCMNRDCLRIGVFDCRDVL